MQKSAHTSWTTFSCVFLHFSRIFPCFLSAKFGFSRTIINICLRAHFFNFWRPIYRRLVISNIKKILKNYLITNNKLNSEITSTIQNVEMIFLCKHFYAHHSNKTFFTIGILSKFWWSIDTKCKIDITATLSYNNENFLFPRKFH